MAGVIADPGELGDHHRDAFQSPQVGVEPIGHRPSQQGLLDLGELAGRQLGIRAGGTPAAQGVHATLLDRACQRWALWRDTPRVRATSAWVWPWANSSAAWSRRASRAARSSAGSGRRVVGIAGPSHSIGPAINPTHETQIMVATLASVMGDAHYKRHPKGCPSRLSPLDRMLRMTLITSAASSR
jgi:hypothetical protein